MALARTFPSSTPHWSKLLIPQIAPWTSTLCSYRAISCPSTDGDSRGHRIVVEGMLPGKVRWGTNRSSTPSARTSSAVRPKASASPCASRLAINWSWWTLAVSSGRSTSGCRNPIRSHGIVVVPWWISW